MKTRKDNKYNAVAENKELFLGRTGRKGFENCFKTTKKVSTGESNQGEICKEKMTRGSTCEPDEISIRIKLILLYSNELRGFRWRK